MPEERGVRVRALKKSFGSHQVLKGIDLDVAPGEVVGLIGPNGAGKTTLLAADGAVERRRGDRGGVFHLPAAGGPIWRGLIPASAACRS